MKKTGVLLMVALVATVSMWSAFQHKKVSDELLLSNIEALAGNECAYGNCFGDGNVLCSNGIRVAYTYSNFHLE